MSGTVEFPDDIRKWSLGDKMKLIKMIKDFNDRQGLNFKLEQPWKYAEYLL